MNHQKIRATPPTSQAALNLQFVHLDITDAETRLTLRHPSLSTLPLVFVREQASPKTPRKETGKSIFTSFYSAYLGRFRVNDQDYLVLATSVVTIRIGIYEVYKATNLVVHPLHGDLPDMLLTQVFNNGFKGRIYFSYFLDLTQNLSESYVTSRHCMNPFFAPFSGLQSSDYQQAGFGWMIPAIFGNISPIRVGEFDLFLIHKESCFEINPECCGDLGLLADFYAPTTLNCTQLVVIEGTQLKAAVSFSLSGLPGLVSFVNDDNEKLEGSNFNPQRIYRFLQFFNEFFRCEHFLFQDSPKARRIFRKLSKFVRSDGIKGKGLCSAERFVGVSDFDDLIGNSSSFVRNLGTVADHSFHFNLVLISEVPPKNFEVVLAAFLKGLASNPSFRQVVPSLTLNDFLGGEEAEKFVSGFWTQCRGDLAEMKKINGFSLEKSTSLAKFVTFGAIFPEVFGGRHFLSHLINRAIRKADSSLFSFETLKLAIIIHNCSGVIADPKEVGYISNPDILDSDLVLVGLQEIVEMKSSNLRNMFTNENTKQVAGWENFFRSAFPDFLLIGTNSMLGLMTLILVKKTAEDRFEVSLEKSSKSKLGFMNLLANKGFLALRLKINFDSILLANCHFESGNSKEAFYKRVEHLKAALSQFESKAAPSLAFLFGDMNFRTDLSERDVQSLLVGIENPANRHYAFEKLSAGDQLRNFMVKENLKAFGVNEAPINFMPTYKFQPRMGRYNPMQAPSW